MKCPIHSMRRIPGRVYDQAPRKLRQAFLDGAVDPESFLKENAWRYPRTAHARFDNQVKSYATASLVIDMYWELVKKQPVDLMLAHVKKKHGGGTHQEKIRSFSVILLALLKAMQNKVLDEAKERHTQKSSSPEDHILMCFFAVATKRHMHLKGLPFPSMADLVVFFARLVGVVPAVFLRDVGRPIEQHELFAIARHPSMLRLCVDVMSNDRRSTYPLFAKFEGKRRGNLNDVDRTYAPDHFEIALDRGRRYLRVKAEVIASHIAHYERADRRRKKRGKEGPRVLGCPALYTGTFREMYEWLCDRFEYWYA